MSLEALNDTECICSDLQEDDYSPFYAWFNYIVIICLLPWLSIFGLLTNICNVFVFSRKRMRNSANTYLFFLACSDFLVILTGLFIFWIDSARTYIQELSQAPYTTVYTLPFGYMAQTCSVYFTVAAAVDCYVNVCWKSQGASYCTVKRARQVCAAVALVSIFYNSMRFPQFNLRKCIPDGTDEFVIEICPTPLFFTINTIYNVYMYMVLMTLMPFFFLLVLNAFIVVKQSLETHKIKKISQVAITNERIVVPEPVPETTTAADDTITMIMVVVLFLCCNTLALIVNIYETFFQPDPVIIHTMSDMSNFLVVFNSSVNCVIYYVFNKEYREIFQNKFIKRICCGEEERRRPPSLYYQNKGTDKNGIYPQKPPAPYMSLNHTPLTDDRASPVWRPLNWNYNSDNLSEGTMPQTDLTKLNDTQSPSLSYVPSIQSNIQLMDDEDEYEYNPQNGHLNVRSTEVRLMNRGEKPKLFVKEEGDKNSSKRTTMSVTAL